MIKGQAERSYPQRRLRRSPQRGRKKIKGVCCQKTLGNRTFQEGGLNTSNIGVRHIIFADTFHWIWHQGSTDSLSESNFSGVCVRLSTVGVGE